MIENLCNPETGKHFLYQTPNAHATGGNKKDTDSASQALPPVQTTAILPTPTAQTPSFRHVPSPGPGLHMFLR